MQKTTHRQNKTVTKIQANEMKEKITQNNRDQPTQFFYTNIFESPLLSNC